MTTLPSLPSPGLDEEIALLARDWRRAGGPVLALLNRLGGGIEAQLGQLPPRLRAEMRRAVRIGLEAAFGLGARAPALGRRGTMAAAVASGAAGGAGGIATALAEMPVTIALILRAVQDEARAQGFDPAEPGLRAASLQVFAAGSPVGGDEGGDSAFLSTRLALTGPALQELLARVAPRLAATLTQKLAAQAVPVIGAVSGAAVNAAYLRYFREMARIRFALMRLSVRHGGPEVVAAFAAATGRRAVTKGKGGA